MAKKRHQTQFNWMGREYVRRTKLGGGLVEAINVYSSDSGARIPIEIVIWPIEFCVPISINSIQLHALRTCSVTMCSLPVPFHFVQSFLLQTYAHHIYHFNNNYCCHHHLIAFYSKVDDRSVGNGFISMISRLFVIGFNEYSQHNMARKNCSWCESKLSVAERNIC